MASMSMARFTVSVGAVMAVAAAGTWLLLQRSPDAKPARSAPGPGKEAAVQDNIIPYIDVIAPEKLKQDFVEFRVTAYEDRKLYFEVTLPKGWENRPVSATREQLRKDDETPLPIGEFAPKGATDVVVEARYIRVPDRVTLDRFMTVYAEKSGFQFVKRQRGDFDGRKVEDALLRMTSPQFGPMVTRLTASRRGDYIFMVAGSCKEADYPKWRQTFAVAALSFNPIGK
jgi:hypothetical protein